MVTYDLLRRRGVAYLSSQMLDGSGTIVIALLAARGIVVLNCERLPQQ